MLSVVCCSLSSCHELFGREWSENGWKAMTRLRIHHVTGLASGINGMRLLLTTGERGHFFEQHGIYTTSGVHLYMGIRNRCAYVPSLCHEFYGSSVS